MYCIQVISYFFGICCGCLVSLENVICDDDIEKGFNSGFLCGLWR